MHPGRLLVHATGHAAPKQPLRVLINHLEPTRHSPGLARHLPVESRAAQIAPFPLGQPLLLMACGWTLGSRQAASVSPAWSCQSQLTGLVETDRDKECGGWALLVCWLKRGQAKWSKLNCRELNCTARDDKLNLISRLFFPIGVPASNYCCFVCFSQPTEIICLRPSWQPASQPASSLCVSRRALSSCHPWRRASCALDLIKLSKLRPCGNGPLARKQLTQ